MSCQTSGRFCYSCQDSLSTSRVRMGSNSMGFGFDAELLTVQRRESAKANQATSQPESRLPSRKSRRSLLPAPKTFVNPNLRTLSSPEPVQTSLAPSSSSSASDSALYVLQIGDRVSVSGYKTGTLKFKGQTTFAQGEWYGVALDEPAGKHNGCIDGVQYFQCQGKHGIFVPVHKIQPLNSQTVSYASTPPAFTGESSSNSNTSADSASSYPKQQKRGKL
ncbi:CAP-Gly domain-containing linker protein 4-like [Ptychodera flava]|uniref:CAP-Gly domain-containing linker protein 4-like n=1 Tax=Ptychodera flava TaxID=63121 RepID=UPI003969C27C